MDRTLSASMEATSWCVEAGTSSSAENKRNSGTLNCSLPVSTQSSLSLAKLSRQDSSKSSESPPIDFDGNPMFPSNR